MAGTSSAYEQEGENPQTQLYLNKNENKNLPEFIISALRSWHIPICNLYSKPFGCLNNSALYPPYFCKKSKNPFASLNGKKLKL
jgi:hypothetical protein